MINGKLKSTLTMARAKETKHKIEMYHPSNLRPFYEFLSLPNLTDPF
jgi:hypothetical protein